MTYTEAVKKAKNGENEGFDFLYQKTYKSKNYLALQYMKDKELAEDVMQEAYIRAFKALDSLEEPETFSAWFGRIVVTTSINELKRQKRYGAESLNHKVSEDGEEFEVQIIDETIENQPELAYTREETRELVHELVNSLSDEQRFCMLMFHIEEQSIKEIADTLQISENTVKSRLNYGRNNIKKKAEELQKKGYKLYSFAPLPLLIWLLKQEETVLALDAGTTTSIAVSQAKIWMKMQSEEGIATTVNIVDAASKARFLSTVAGKVAVAVVAALVTGGSAAVIVYNQDAVHTENVGTVAEAENKTEITIEDSEENNTDTLSRMDEKKEGVIPEVSEDREKEVKYEDGSWQDVYSKAIQWVISAQGEDYDGMLVFPQIFRENPPTDGSPQYEYTLADLDSDGIPELYMKINFDTEEYNYNSTTMGFYYYAPTETREATYDITLGSIPANMVASAGGLRNSSYINSDKTICMVMEIYSGSGKAYLYQYTLGDYTVMNSKPVGEYTWDEVEGGIVNGALAGYEEVQWLSIDTPLEF